MVAVVVVAVAGASGKLLTNKNDINDHNIRNNITTNNNDKK